MALSRQHFIDAWKRSFDYKGCATRSEYWSLTLGNFLIILLAGAAMAVLAMISTVAMAIVGVIFVLGVIAALFPGVAITVRRCHDINWSGWCVFLTSIPIIGFFISLYIAFAPTKAPSETRFPASTAGKVVVVVLGVAGFMANIFFNIAATMATKVFSSSASSSSDLSSLLASTQSLENQLIDIADEINKGLPKELDEVTTLIVVTAEGNRLSYTYQLTANREDIDLGFFRDTMNESLNPEYCSNLAEYFAGMNYSANYEYYGADANHITTLSYAPSDCH
jgi:uncharacterized membrane protein YhaH (DUF805 family)